ncbi:MAG TPA: hypothetical protein PLW93_03485, partial [Candidatus Absconditabacterales bacterium]|nr:hypothetical protein [Candidatus Absconditabacterales bacterium]HNG97308.1 hypothetical protein [Candidatus Absconditabacterales bacterium]
LLGIKNMGSLRLLYNRYNTKRSFMITTWKRSGGSSSNADLHVEGGLHKTQIVTMRGSFLGIISLP